jgi:hypothetical protein
VCECAHADRFTSRSGRYPEYHWGDIPGHDIDLLIQHLDDGASRVHLDIHTTDVDAEVARPEQLAATRIRQVHERWIMQDPAGLPFCVIPDDGKRLTDDKAVRWN